MNQQKKKASYVLLNDPSFCEYSLYRVRQQDQHRTKAGQGLRADSFYSFIVQMLRSSYCNSAIHLNSHFKEVTSLHGIGHEDKTTSEWITPLVKDEKVLHHENNAKYH